MTVTFQFWAPYFGDCDVTADVIGTNVFVTSLVQSTNRRSMLDRPMSGADRARLHRSALDAALERDDERAGAA